MTEIRSAEVESWYPYRDDKGRVLFEVLRLRPKGFKLVDDQGTELTDFPRPLVPYRLPELLAADPAETIYLPEGEKDVDTLCELGLVATTNPGGCRLGWQEDYGRWFAGRHVVILPDNDNPGRRHAEKAAALLSSQAASVVIVPLPGLGGGQDVSDWLARGRSVEELAALVAKARYAAAGLRRSPIKAQKGDLILRSALPSQHKLLLLALLHLLGGQEAAGVSVPDLAGRLSLHRVTCQKLISDLRRRGILVRHPHGHAIAWDILAAIQPQASPVTTTQLTTASGE